MEAERQQKLHETTAGCDQLKTFSIGDEASAFAVTRRSYRTNSPVGCVLTIPNNIPTMPVFVADHVPLRRALNCEEDELHQMATPGARRLSSRAPHRNESSRTAQGRSRRACWCNNLTFSRIKIPAVNVFPFPIRKMAPHPVPCREVWTANGALLCPHRRS